MKVNSKTGYKIVRDEVGASYLVPAAEVNKFYNWVDSRENGLTSEYDYDNCAVDLSRIKVYSWEQ